MSHLSRFRPMKDIQQGQTQQSIVKVSLKEVIGMKGKIKPWIVYKVLEIKKLFCF